MTGEKRREYVLTVYKTAFRREWRWRLTHVNGNKVANGGEGYKNKRECINQATKVLDMERVDAASLAPYLQGGL